MSSYEGLNVKTNVMLAQYSTFRCGGPAKYFAQPSSEEEILALLDAAKNNGDEVFILGSGSNILFSDKGFDGLVIKIGKEFGEVTVEDEGDTALVKAQAGAPMATFGMKCARNSLQGAEFICGIPGSVGGGVYMNAGAYGGEMKNIAVSVRYIYEGEIHEIAAEDCQFGYRTSIFEKNPGMIVTGFTARLPKGDKAQIDALVAELREKRTKSQPLDVPSAGSTFKRPEGYFAGKLIEDSGLKGFALNDSGAQVSPKHAGFVVNNGGKAKASDVMELIRYIQDKVFADSGVHLETEVRLVGGDF